MAQAKHDPTQTRVTRRLAITTALASAAIPVAGAALVIPIVDDPIYAAIERHKAALAALDAACKEWGRCEQPKFDKLPYNEEALEAAHRIEYAAGEALGDVEWELANTVPASLAGVLAALAYQRELRSIGT